MTPPLTCTDCGVALKPNKRRKGTRCKLCCARALGKSEDRREKCRAAMKRLFARPGYYENHCDRTARGIRAALQCPDRMADLRERGRRCGKLRLGQTRHGPGSPSRVAAGRRRSETVLAWCPMEYRDDYRRLKEVDLISAPEARRMIEAQIARDLERYAATGVLPQATRRKARA